MGTRSPSVINLRELARIASKRIRSSRFANAKTAVKPLASPGKEAVATTAGGSGWAMEGSAAAEKRREDRLPLSEVVTDCVRRWFRDALEEAKAGDAAMQVLVGQMYHSGYGVPRNEQKAKVWLAKASRHRSSVWKVSEKHPGYNASDSDSDEIKKEKS